MDVAGEYILFYYWELLNAVKGVVTGPTPLRLWMFSSPIILSEMTESAITSTRMEDKASNVIWIIMVAFPLLMSV